MGEFPHELTWYKKTEQTNVFERYVLNRISWQQAERRISENQEC